MSQTLPDKETSMSEAIIRWLGGHDTGSSSKAIALTALGVMPAGAEHNYPSDGADFGRCHRLLTLAPEARKGLDMLGEKGGPYWRALRAKWDELTAAYVATDGHIYDQMRAILDPIRDAGPRVFRLGSGATLVTPKGR